MEYRNKFEGRVAATLGNEFQYETTRMPYTLAHRYLPDFIDVAGKRIVEGKGRFTAQDRAKMKAVREQYADWDITIVFQRPHTPISKGSATTYASWCTRHNIKWRQVK